MERIEFARDGSALVTVSGGALRIVELDGRVRAAPPIEHRVLDARWPAGQIVVFDGDATFRWYDTRGELVDTRPIQWARARWRPDREVAAIAASLSADGHRVMVKTWLEISLLAASGDPVWKLDGGNLVGFRSDEFSGLGFVLSDGGQMIAVSYQIRAWDRVYNRAEEPARGWAVIAVDDNRLLDRGALKTPLEPPAMAFAFDRAGKRFAYSTPERIRIVGAMRLGRRGDVVPDRQGGARAVAFDPLGVVAAWAYPRTATRSRPRLRVDYLDPRARGETRIDIADTLYLEPALPDVVAIAFSPDGRSIACLASDGATEIVVVP